MQSFLTSVIFILNENEQFLHENWTLLKKSLLQSKIFILLLGEIYEIVLKLALFSKFFT